MSEPERGLIHRSDYLGGRPVSDTHQTSYPGKLVRSITAHLRGTLVGGLLIMFPIIITYVVLKWLFDSVDGFLQPVIQDSLGRQVPGLGLMALVLVLYVAGLTEKNYLSRHILGLGKAMLLRIPIISAVYSPASQLIRALSGIGDTGFRQVVMLEYPRKGAWTIGFLTANTTDSNGSPLSIIYIPTAPTPNSGWIAILPEQDIRYTDLSVATAMHLVLSGGIIAPPVIGSNQVT